jgi:hypothetical protein
MYLFFTKLLTYSMDFELLQDTWPRVLVTPEIRDPAQPRMFTFTTAAVRTYVEVDGSWTEREMAIQFKRAPLG